MIEKRSLLAAILLLATASAVAAQPSLVNIQLRPGEPRTIEVAPNAAAVCRNTPNCPTELNIRWVGPKGSDESERILVEYKDGLFWGEDGNPSSVEPQVCFDFPGGENPIELDNGAANGKNLVFKKDSPDCPDKVAFFFDISCQNKAGDNCGGVETLDPGTMVDNGKRSD